MPQLDLSFFPSQLFWLFVGFMLLFIFVNSYVSPRMFKVFEERDSRIAGTFRRAEKLRNEAKKFESEYNAKLNHAFKAASIRIADAIDDFRKENDAKKASRDKETLLLSQQSEKSINEFKKKSQAELLELSIDIVQQVVKNLIGTEIISRDETRSKILIAKRELSLR